MIDHRALFRADLCTRSRQTLNQTKSSQSNHNVKCPPTSFFKKCTISSIENWKAQQPQLHTVHDRAKLLNKLQRTYRCSCGSYWRRRHFSSSRSRRNSRRSSCRLWWNCKRETSSCDSKTHTRDTHVSWAVNGYMKMTSCFSVSPINMHKLTSRLCISTMTSRCFVGMYCENHAFTDPG